MLVGVHSSLPRPEPFPIEDNPFFSNPTFLTLLPEAKLQSLSIVSDAYGRVFSEVRGLFTTRLLWVIAINNKLFLLACPPAMVRVISTPCA